MKIKRYKHSGVYGDLLYSLAVCQHFGPGEFYLHLGQIDWIGQHYYGSQPNKKHQGRMTKQDFEFMRDFMIQQPYITDFQCLTNSTEITHNLDRFRTLFTQHPGNYISVYADTFGIKNEYELRKQPWLYTKNIYQEPNRPIVINRTERWLPPTLPNVWQTWREQDLDYKSLFVGSEDEYLKFKDITNFDIPHIKTDTQLELAEVIAGSELFIGNQSQCLALAVGLGKPFKCELRRDLPQHRNECWFENQLNGEYF